MSVHSTALHIHPQGGDDNMETHQYGNTTVNIHFDHVKTGPELDQVKDDIHYAAWDIIEELVSKGESV